MPDLSKLSNSIKNGFGAIIEAHALRLDCPTAYSARLVGQSVVIELESTPQDDWLSRADLVGKDSSSLQDVKCHLLFVFLIRWDTYFDELLEIESMDSSELFDARCQLLNRGLGRYCDDLLSGDFSRLLHQEHYREVERMLDWAFVPGLDPNAAEVKRHRSLVYKYNSGDISWMKQYFELIIRPKIFV